MKRLLARFWPMGTLFLGGFILIVYVALGILYLQQGVQQKEFTKQIVKLGAVVAKPIPSAAELQTEYEEVNHILVPMTDYEAIGLIVDIAKEHGIDVDPNSGKFSVPSARIKKVKVGGSDYQVRSFKNIRVQSDYENVMAFLTDLDSGKTRETMVLQKVATSEKEVMYIGEEASRREEFRQVASAVEDMMEDTGLSRIPNPMNFAGGVAANLTGDDPDTEEVVEGFPDITTPAIDRGYTGTGSPRNGYVLFEHDKISADNATQFEPVSYISILTTEYYYTCEADGTVRQFDGADVLAATEYLGSAESKMETIATMDVDIYSKPEE